MSFSGGHDNEKQCTNNQGWTLEWIYMLIECHVVKYL